MINTTGVWCEAGFAFWFGAGSAYYNVAHETDPDFWCGMYVQFLVFYVEFYILLFVFLSFLFFSCYCGVSYFRFMSLNSLCYLSHIFRNISAFKLMQEIRRPSSLNSFYLFFNLLFALNYTSASASTIRTVSLCFYYDFVLWTDLRPFQLFLFILCSDVLLLHCSPRLGGVCRK